MQATNDGGCTSLLYVPLGHLTMSKFWPNFVLIGAEPLLRYPAGMLAGILHTKAREYAQLVSSHLLHPS